MGKFVRRWCRILFRRSCRCSSRFNDWRKLRRYAVLILNINIIGREGNFTAIFVSKYTTSLNHLANQIKKSAQNMSLSRQVPLGYGGATYTHLPNSTRNNIPLRQVVVNPDIRNITNIYEGLNAYQAGSLDAAIEIGASRSANKVGSLEHINKVKEALDDMITSPTNAYYRDSLIEVKKRIDDILQTKADKILRPYNAYENFVNSISDKMQYIYPYIGGYYMQNRQPL